MKIGIDVRAAIEEPAGIGKLVGNLTKQLLSIDTENEYVLYSNAPFDPGIHNPRVRTALINLEGIPGGRMLWHVVVTLRARLFDRVDRFVSVASLQVVVMTRDLVILVVPDLTNVLFPQWHVGKPRLTGKLFLKRALRNARRVIAISGHTRTDLLQQYRGVVSEGKVSVAHIACEEEFTRPVPAGEIDRIRTKYALKSNYILTVGTVEPRKNLPALIDAFAEIARTNPDVELIVAGRKGWKWEETFEAVDRTGVGNRIRFLGYVPPQDLPALYAGALLFAYPSFYEGFGIPPLEAMSVGIPVVVSNTSSLPEVVGDAAIMVAPWDAQALREGILKIMGDGDLRARLSGLGRKQAAKFSWEAFARRILQEIAKSA